MSRRGHNFPSDDVHLCEEFADYCWKCWRDKGEQLEAQVREALLSEEAAETVARIIHYHQAGGREDWADFGGERRAFALEYARLALQALADSQLGGSEDG